jgi:hypothetical protein
MAAVLGIRTPSAIPIALIILFLDLVAAPSTAMQLHWSGGGTDLVVTQDARAMLVVQADQTEGSLPDSWRLQWVADSSGIQFSAVQPAMACLADTAKIDSVGLPATAADSSAHLMTARFCSQGSIAGTACYLIDLVGGSKGKLRIIAYDSSNQLIQSNEVTFNGGIDGDYPPALLATTYSRSDTALTFHAVGSGLGTVLSTSLEAPDGTWSFPLAIAGQDDSSLTAVATITATVPDCVLSASLNTGSTVEAPVAGESIQMPMTPLFNVEMLDPNLDFYPKDFALVYTPGKFHVIYIRHNAWERAHGGTTVPDSLNERAFGHLWTSNWTDWEGDPAPTDTTILSTLDGTWDNVHVWAPTIVQQGLEFYMFYTGVQYGANGFRVQRMGLARSFDLTHWTRNGPPVDSVEAVFWADKSTQRELAFRDPFVMPDPTRPTGWLMYYVANIAGRIPQMAVGVARSKSDTLGGAWTNLPNALLISDDAHTFGAGKAESPHVFWDHGNWQLLFTTGSGHPISLATNPGVPIDTVASDSSNWALTRLYYELLNGGESTLDASDVDHWSGTEYLTVSGREFLGAYDGVGIRIQEMHWRGTTPDYFALTDPAASADRGMLATIPLLRFAGPNPSRGGTSLAIAATVGEHVQLDVYDVAGRRVRQLWNGPIPAGRLTVAWDGHDTDGRQLSAGIYFAKMSCREGNRSLRVPLLW